MCAVAVPYAAGTASTFFAFLAAAFFFAGFFAAFFAFFFEAIVLKSFPPRCGAGRPLALSGSRRDRVPASSATGDDGGLHIRRRSRVAGQRPKIGLSPPSPSRQQS